jgi:hypothetical protein
MAELTRTPPRVTHPPIEKQRLDTCNANLEKQIKKLKAKTAELEAALERKAKATIAAPKEDKAEAQSYASCRNVRVVAAAAPDGRDRAALRGTQLASDRIKARYDRPANLAGLQKLIKSGCTARLGPQ